MLKLKSRTQRFFSGVHTVFTEAGNNRRALFLHFAVSIVAVLTAESLVNFILFTVLGQNQHALGLILSLIPTAIAAYFVGGFIFLRPNPKPLSSVKTFTKFLVIIMAFLTVGVIFAVIDGFVRPNPYEDVSFLYSVVLIFLVFLWPLGLFANALAFGLLAFPIEIGNLIYGPSAAGDSLNNLLMIAGIPLLIAGAYLPSLLMAAGAKFRWLLLPEEKKLALEEESVHD